MRIDKASISKLLGGSKEVVCYGLSSCMYGQVVRLLGLEKDLQVHDVLDYEDVDRPIALIETDAGGDDVKRICKAGITSLLLENYKRMQQGQPIIPLIFCVEFHDDDTDIMLDVERVAKLSGIKSSVTDAELRRCFKSYYEMDADMQRVAEQTFKFVSVRQDKKEEDLYHLDEVAPFWNHPKWKQLWTERSGAKVKKSEPKKHAWREIVKTQTTLFKESHAKPETEKKSSVKWFDKLRKK